MTVLSAGGLWQVVEKCDWRCFPTSCNAAVTPCSTSKKQNPEAKCICLAVNVVKLMLHTWNITVDQLQPAVNYRLHPDCQHWQSCSYLLLRLIDKLLNVSVYCSAIYLKAYYLDIIMSYVLTFTFIAFGRNSVSNLWLKTMKNRRGTYGVVHNYWHPPF